MTAQTKRRYRFLFPFLSAMAVIIISQPLHAGTYTDSAHGGSGTGVKRTVLTDYCKGNCAHCHEQHASIDGTEPTPSSGSASPFALFSPNFNLSATVKPYLQSDNFCFYCHTNTSSLQFGGIDNKDHAATFGGYTTNSPLGIFEAFNQSSYHNLKDIVVFAEPTFSYFKATSNPCTGCHNPHIARRNKANVQNPDFTAISKPSDHDNLWGNDAAERMNMATSNKYKAPYYYNSTTTYEPGALVVSTGFLTPDYNGFCTDCHNTTNTIYSTSLGRNLKLIDWNNEKHGKGAADIDIRVSAPYTAGSGSLGYVLSCLDCHEPHGSPNLFLLRREVNGVSLSGTITTGTNLAYLCERCHDKAGATWENIHHSLTDYPYNKNMCGTCHGGYPQNCMRCHFHGAITGSGGVNTATRVPNIRRTF